MEEERIEADKAWLEPQSIWDIQVFLGFAKFYRRFIKGFNKIAAPLTSMVKITAPLVPARPAQPRANGNQLDTDSGGGISSGKIDDILANLSSFTKKMSSGAGFLTPKASLPFTGLRKAFIKAPILHHFDPKHHIQIETDASSCAIGGVLYQLTTKRGLTG